MPQQASKLASRQAGRQASNQAGKQAGRQRAGKGCRGGIRSAKRGWVEIQSGEENEGVEVGERERDDGAGSRGEEGGETRGVTWKRVG